MTTLVIVEDDQTLRTHLAEMLQLENFVLYEAANGLDGLELIQRVQPDLVICDIAMPVLDGFGMVEAMRQSYETVLIPVIFVTARKNAYFPDRVTQLGAAPLLYKPFSVETLLEAIWGHLDVIH